MKKLIKNGIIVTAINEYKADILIDQEKIKAIGTNFDMVVDKVIDAEGMYVLPGGVDQHTHYDAVNNDGITSNAGYETSYGALVGGTTTIVDFAPQDQGKGMIDSAMYRKEKRTKDKVAPDFALHALCTNVTEDTFKEMAELPKYGISTMKIFMAYKPSPLYVNDADFFKFMRLAKQSGITMYAHAENADLLNLLRDESFAAGNTSPKYHYITRPPFVEAEATLRAITLAEAAGCPLCIVHVSCIEAAQAIQSARDKGQAVIGETCTHYLVLDKHKMDNPDFDQASRWVCSPALRDEIHQEHLWKALRRDWLSVVASDYCGIPLYQKHWGENDFRAIPNGSPTAGDRLHMLWTYGVEKGKMSRQKLVEVYATTPAKLCGIFPRKGTIDVGSDADIVIYNPNYRGKVSIETNPSGVEYNVFEGLDQIGRVETVLLRGKVVVDKNQYVGTPGEGQFIPGEPYGLAYDLLEK
jgi:dihydropyrimidinase